MCVCKIVEEEEEEEEEKKTGLASQECGVPAALSQVNGTE
jgi:hypothetical protein